MTLDELCDSILDEGAVLFIGAGFSKNARGQMDAKNMPTGYDLSIQLHQELGLTGKALELQDIARLYVKRKSTEQLYDLLQNLFICKSFTPEQGRIAGARWKRVYTTNYDDVMETASKSAGVALRPYTFKDKVEDKPRQIVHINGYIRDAHASTLDADLRLTSTSYLSAAFRDTAWATFFREDVRLAEKVVFVGYSLYDLDIRAILWNIEDMKSKVALVVSETTDDLDAERMSDFGEVFRVGLGGLASRLETRRGTHVPRKKLPTFHSFREDQNQSTTVAVSDRDVFDLILHGELKTGLLAKDIAENSGFYTILRDRVDDAIVSLTLGKLPVLAVSEFANGKTVFVSQIAQRLRDQGVRTFWLTNEDKLTLQGLTEILDNCPLVAIVIENASDHHEVVQSCLSRMRDGLYLLLSERRPVLEARGLVPASSTPPETARYDIDRLSKNEIEHLEQFLTRHGLWGENVALGKIGRIEYIRNELHGEFKNVLLEVIQSPRIRAMLKDMFRDFDPSSEKSEPLILGACLREITGDAPELYDIAELLGAPYSAKIGSFSNAATLYRVSNGQLNFRSGVLARYFLREVLSVDFIVPVLTKAAKNACRLALNQVGRKQDFYQGLFEKLTIFRLIDPLLPEGGASFQGLVNHYDELKSLPLTQRNHHFWLQFGICRMFTRQYDMAEKYFQTAYGLLASRGGEKERTAIDNHYARLLLERPVYDIRYPAENAADDLLKAINLLKPQVLLEEKYYAFRVAAHLLDFFKRFGTQLPADYVNAAKAFVDTTLERISQMESSPGAAHRNIALAKRKLLDLERTWPLYEKG